MSDIPINVLVNLGGILAGVLSIGMGLWFRQRFMDRSK
jgi:hypothetical protein